MALNVQADKNEEVEEFIEDAISDLKEETSQILNEMNKGATIAYKVIIGGDPADRILQIAKDEDVDLIVMYSGRSAIKKLAKLATVSRKVADDSQCAVLIMH